MVIPHCLKGRERAWKIRSFVVTLDRFNDTPECLRLCSSFRRDAIANNEACDERVFGGEKMDNLCANTQLRGDGGTGVFASPVNT